MNDGWIKLHRNSMENNIFIHDPTAWHIFEYLLLVSDRKTGNRETGRFQIAEILHIKSTTVYQALKRLEKCKMIDITSNNKYSVIHICNFSKYQSSNDSYDDNKLTTDRQQNDNKMTLNKKKEVRIKNNSNVELLSQYQPLHENICKLFSKNINQYKLTDKRKKILATRLKDTGEENIIKACDALSKSSFHMGDNARNWIADPYWCLQSVEKAEEWSNKFESSGYKGNLTELEI